MRVAEKRWVLEIAGGGAGASYFKNSNDFRVYHEPKSGVRINFCGRCDAVQKGRRALGTQLQLQLMRGRQLITRRIAASPSAARSNANRPGIYRVK